MDGESLRAKRAAELEAKRKKLEELRKRKALNRSPPTQQRQQATPDPNIQPQKLDDFLEKILKSPAVKEETSIAEPVPDENKPPPAPQPTIDDKFSKLSVISNVATVHIPSIIREVYHKHTQTETEEIAVQTEQGQSSMEERLSFGSGTLVPTEASQQEVPIAETHCPSPKKIQMISNDEKESIFQSSEFEDFITKSARFVERAIEQSQKYDVMVDYGSGDATTQDNLSNDEALTRSCDIFDSRWSKSRTVVNIDISSFFNELILAAYSSPNEGNGRVGSNSSDWDNLMSTDPDGLVLLWSLTTLTRPEYVFTCQSQVLVAQFHPFDSHLVVGGTYCGQIMLWDTRSKSSPVHRTPLSSNGHTHPVYCMSIVGTKNSHNLVSASTDGRICVWNLSKLLLPTDTLELKTVVNPSIPTAVTSATTREKKVDVSVTSFANIKNESNKLCFGSESGDIFKVEVHRFNEEGRADTGEMVVDPVHKGHFGPVTSMHYNPCFEANGDTLLLSSSVDWSCKLWSSKAPKVPLLSFEHSVDYVLDVRWSSVHPSLFATVDGSGSLCLWNINDETEVPIAEIQVSDHALNRLLWTAHGQRIIVGDSAGRLYVYDVAGHIATPRQDEKARFDSTISTASGIVDHTKAIP